MLDPGTYDIYPVHPLGEGQIFCGHESLAERMIAAGVVVMDGYQGVFFEQLREVLQQCFREQGFHVHWVRMADALKGEDEILEMVTPFLGGDDPLFGTRTTLELKDFFDTGQLSRLQPDPAAAVNIVYGPGAGLATWEGLLVYVDLPKNEMQYRARAGSITNLGAGRPADPKSMYKRFYFVDWILLNRHKEALLPQLDILVDGQLPGEPAWIEGDVFRDALRSMSQNVFRVRPWFEPGTWGGQWIREHIPGLNREVVNYAWSFELIVPENGLLLGSSGRRLEFSFDFLMYYDAASVLGLHAPVFGKEFPIRFDFLDTMKGGNLSIQCHPRADYIREHFGETFTQEEAYYILDASEGALCYLGFHEDIEPEAFQTTLEQSFEKNTPVTVTDFVLAHPSRKHDFFLIPPGTIHGSGRNNLVLEVSTTPYIFTFKMYDWLRPDLDGQPRPLNISRGMANLRFDRRGDKALKELVPKPVLIIKGEDWQLYDLPTHPGHSYEVKRYHFITELNIETRGVCHVLSLVEGSHIVLETRQGVSRTFHYAETFVIPAAAGSYRVVNQSSGAAMLLIASMK